MHSGVSTADDDGSFHCCDDVLQSASAEEELAQELQEAIAEAHIHQTMAAQRRGPLSLTQQVVVCLSPCAWGSGHCFSSQVDQTLKA